MDTVDDRQRLNEENTDLIEHNSITAYPNPFSNSTTIEYKISSDAQTSLFLYNMQGEQVAQLVNGKAQAEGVYQVEIDAMAYPAGIYYATLWTGKELITEKLIIVK